MNTDVPGSPGSCRATAVALDRLARQLERADRLATRGARTSERSFAGSAADAYRAACAGLADSASAHATSARRAAGALASYGEELAAVQRVMERVRTSAGGHGLLQGTDLVPPVAPTPHQRDVFDRLSAIAADAHGHLERARDRLNAAFPGQSFPADYGSVLLPPADEPAGPLLFPPPESAWPTDERGDEPRPDRAPRDGAGTDRRAERDGVPGGSEAPDEVRGAGGGEDIGYGDSDSARLPGHVLRPAPEPVP